MKKFIIVIVSLFAVLLISFFIFLGMKSDDGDDEPVYIPPHEHVYVEGKCECGLTDPNYVAPHKHVYVEGECECGAIDPNYVAPHEHEFINGKCECGKLDPKHIHEYINGECICGKVELYETVELTDIDRAVYAMLYEDLSHNYDTFLGGILVTDDETTDFIFGITYVDYAEMYEDEFGNVYFSSGFITINNQFNIKLERGLEIISFEEDYDETLAYIYDYETTEFYSHFIYDNHYIKYEIIDDVLSYTADEVTDDLIVDDSRGNIYDYDKKEYVYIINEVDYVPIDGVSLVGEGIYDDVIAEVNKIIAEQDMNFSYEEIKSYILNSQEHVVSYLLGLQEEVFLGVPVDELISTVKRLDPLEYIRLTVNEDGSTNYSIINITKVASQEEKIAIGAICGVGIVGGVACNLLTTVFPQAKLILGPVGGVLTGVCMEVMMQVVMSNVPVSDIEWEKVAIAAASGAIAGFLYVGMNKWMTNVNSKGSKALIEIFDSVIDGVIGETEMVIYQLIDGKPFNEAVKHFGLGVIFGAIISGAFKGVSYGAGAAVKAIQKNADLTFLPKVFKKLAINDTNPGRTLSRILENADEAAKLDITQKDINRIKKITKKISSKEPNLSQEEILNRLYNIVKMRNLLLISDNNKFFQMTDKFGNVVNKKGVTSNIKGEYYVNLKQDVPDEIRQLFKNAKGEPVERLRIVNGFIQFDDVSFGKVILPQPITNNRKKNFANMDEALAEQWRQNPNTIPKSVADIFKEEGIDVDFLDARSIEMLRYKGFTWHEGENGLTGYLVRTALHDEIAHIGGFAINKVYEIGDEFVRKLIVKIFGNFATA